MRYFWAFAGGTWVGLVAASAVSIFVFGFHERVFGPSGTFRMVLWYSPLPAVFAGASAWLGARGTDRLLPAGPLAVAVAAFGIALALLMAIGDFARPAGWLFFPFLVLVPFFLVRFGLQRYGILRVSPDTER